MTRAEARVWLANYLPCKSEHLSSSPRTHIKARHDDVCCNPNNRDIGGGDRIPGTSLANWPSLLDDILGQ